MAEIDRSTGSIEKLKSEPGALHSPLYVRVVPKDQGDVLDHLCARSEQLHALLATTYGESPLWRYNNQIQDAYLWNCSTLASEVAELVKSLASMRSAARSRSTGHEVSQ